MGVRVPHPPPDLRSYMIVKKVKCGCNKVIFDLTEIQFNDFNLGIMGFLRCPNCKKIVLPSHRSETEIEIKENEAPGEDPGWS